MRSFRRARSNMFYTYVLYCVNTKKGRKKNYIGSTGDVEKRVIAHLSKSTETTKSFDFIKLVYYEACLNKKDAIIREKQLKTGFGRGYLKRRIKNYLNLMRRSRQTTSDVVKRD